MKISRSVGVRPVLWPPLWLTFICFATIAASETLLLWPLIVIGIFGTAFLMQNHWTSSRKPTTLRRKLLDIIVVFLQAMWLGCMIMQQVDTFKPDPNVSTTNEEKYNSAMSGYLWYYWYSYGLKEHVYKLRKLRKGKVVAPMNFLYGDALLDNLNTFRHRTGQNETGFRFWYTFYNELRNGMPRKFGALLYILADLCYFQTIFTKLYWEDRHQHYKQLYTNNNNIYNTYTSFYQHPYRFFYELPSILLNRLYQTYLIGMYIVFYPFWKRDPAVAYFDNFRKLFVQWRENPSDENLDVMLVKICKRTNPKSIAYQRKLIQRYGVTKYVTDFLLKQQELYKAKTGIDLQYVTSTFLMDKPKRRIALSKIWLILISFFFLLSLADGRKYKHTNEVYTVVNDMTPDTMGYIYEILTDMIWVVFGSLLNWLVWFVLAVLMFFCSYFVFVYSIRTIYRSSAYERRTGISRWVYRAACLLPGYGPTIWKLNTMTIVSGLQDQLILVKELRGNIHQQFCTKCHCTGHVKSVCPMANLGNPSMVESTKFMDVTYAKTNNIYIDPAVNDFYVFIATLEAGAAPVENKLKKDSDRFRSVSAIIKGTKDMEKDPLDNLAFETLEQLHRTETNYIGNDRQKGLMTPRDFGSAQWDDNDIEDDDTSVMSDITADSDGSAVSAKLQPFNTSCTQYSLPHNDTVHGQKLHYLFGKDGKKIYIIQSMTPFERFRTVNGMDDLIDLVKRGQKHFHCEFLPVKLDFMGVHRVMTNHIYLSFKSLQSSMYYTPRTGLRVIKIFGKADKTPNLYQLVNIGTSYHFTFSDRFVDNLDEFYEQITKAKNTDKLHFIICRGIYPGTHVKLFESLCEFVVKHNHVITSALPNIQQRIEEHFDTGSAYRKLITREPRDSDYPVSVKGLNGGVNEGDPDVKRVPYTTAEINVMQDKAGLCVTCNKLKKDCGCVNCIGCTEPEESCQCMRHVCYLNTPLKTCFCTTICNICGLKRSECRCRFCCKHCNQPPCACKCLKAKRADTIVQKVEKRKITGVPIVQTVVTPTAPIQPTVVQPAASLTTKVPVTQPSVTYLQPAIIVPHPSSVNTSATSTKPIPTVPAVNMTASTSVTNVIPMTSSIAGVKETLTEKGIVEDRYGVGPTTWKVNNVMQKVAKDYAGSANMDPKVMNMLEQYVAEENEETNQAQPKTRQYAAGDERILDYTFIKSSSRDFLAMTSSPDVRSHMWMPGPHLSHVRPYGERPFDWRVLARLISENRGVEHDESQYTVLNAFFEQMQHDEKRFVNLTFLPKLFTCAKEYFDYFGSGLPVFRTGEIRKLTLTKRQVCCILANGFLCTLKPLQQTNRRLHMQDFSFHRLFNAPGFAIKMEKLKCLYNYFKRTLMEEPQGEITFQLTASRLPAMDQHKLHFVPCFITTEGKIEETIGFTEIDFANKYIGGGVLGFGSVQEELRMMISPELMAAMYFVEALADDAVLSILGTEKYNSIAGYGGTAKFTGSIVDDTPIHQNHRLSEVVAMDAIKYQHTMQQFNDSKIYRELRKAYSGFHRTGMRGSAAICTGNWGCGAFNGDKVLKFCIQYIASVIARRPMVYITFGDAALAEWLAELSYRLVLHRVHVGELLGWMNNYNGKVRFPKYLTDMLHGAQARFEQVHSSVDVIPDPKDPALITTQAANAISTQTSNVKTRAPISASPVVTPSSSVCVSATTASSISTTIATATVTSVVYTSATVTTSVNATSSNLLPKVLTMTVISSPTFVSAKSTGSSPPIQSPTPNSSAIDMSDDDDDEETQVLSVVLPSIQPHLDAPVKPVIAASSSTSTSTSNIRTDPSITSTSTSSITETLDPTVSGVQPIVDHAFTNVTTVQTGYLGIPPAGKVYPKPPALSRPALLPTPTTPPLFTTSPSIATLAPSQIIDVHATPVLKVTSSSEPKPDIMPDVQDAKAKFEHTIRLANQTVARAEQVLSPLLSGVYEQIFDTTQRMTQHGLMSNQETIVLSPTTTSVLPTSDYAYEQQGAKPKTRVGFEKQAHVRFVDSMGYTDTLETLKTGEEQAYEEARREQMSSEKVNEQRDCQLSMDSDETSKTIFSPQQRTQIGQVIKNRCEEIAQQKSKVPSAQDVTDVTELYIQKRNAAAGAYVASSEFLTKAPIVEVAEYYEDSDDEEEVDVEGFPELQSFDTNLLEKTMPGAEPAIYQGIDIEEQQRILDDCKAIKKVQDEDIAIHGTVYTDEDNHITTEIDMAAIALDIHGVNDLTGDGVAVSKMYDPTLLAMQIEEKVTHGEPLSDGELDFLTTLAEERDEIIDNYIYATIEKKLRYNLGMKDEDRPSYTNSVGKPVFTVSAARRLRGYVDTQLIITASKYQSQGRSIEDETPLVWDHETIKYVRSKFPSIAAATKIQFRPENSILPYVTTTGGSNSSSSSSKYAEEYLKVHETVKTIKELRRMTPVNAANVDKLVELDRMQRVAQEEVKHRRSTYMRQLILEQTRVNKQVDLDLEERKLLARRNNSPTSSMSSISSTGSSSSEGGDKPLQLRPNGAGRGLGYIAGSFCVFATLFQEENIVMVNDAFVVKPCINKMRVLFILCLLIVIFMPCASAASVTTQYYSNNQTYVCLDASYHYSSNLTLLKSLSTHNTEVTIHNETVKDYACQMRMNGSSCFGDENGKTLKFMDLEDNVYHYVDDAYAAMMQMCGQVEELNLFHCVYGAVGYFPHYTEDSKAPKVYWQCEMADNTYTGFRVTPSFLKLNLAAYYKEIEMSLMSGRQSVKSLPKLVRPNCVDDCELNFEKNETRWSKVFYAGIKHLVECHVVDLVCQKILETYNNTIPSRTHVADPCDINIANCLFHNNSFICFNHDTLVFHYDDTAHREIKKHLDLGEEDCNDTVKMLNVSVEWSPAALLDLPDYLLSYFNIQPKVIHQLSENETLERKIEDDISYTRRCYTADGKRICRSWYWNDTENETLILNITCVDFARRITDFVSLPEGNKTAKMSCENGAIWIVDNPEHFFWYLGEFMPNALPHFNYGSLFNGKIKLATSCGLSRIFWNCYAAQPTRIRCGSLTGVYDIDSWFRPICQMYYANINVVVKTAYVESCNAEKCTTGPYSTIYSSKGSHDFDLHLSPGAPVINIKISGPVDLDQHFFLPFSPDNQGYTGFINVVPTSNISLPTSALCYGTNWMYQKYTHKETRAYWSSKTEVYTGEIDDEDIECYTHGVFKTILSKFFTEGGYIAIRWLVIFVILAYLLMWIRGFIEKTCRRYVSNAVQVCDIMFHIFIVFFLTLVHNNEPFWYYLACAYFICSSFFYAWLRLRDTGYNKSSHEFGSYWTFAIIVAINLIALLLWYGDLIFYVLIAIGFMFLFNHLYKRYCLHPWDYDIFYITPDTISTYYRYCEKTYGDKFNMRYAHARREIETMSIPDPDKLRTYYEFNFLNEIRTLNDSNIKTKYWKKMYSTVSTLGYAGVESKRSSHNTSLEGIVSLAPYKSISTPDIDANLILLYYGNTSLNGLVSGDKLFVPRHLFLNGNKTYEQIYEHLHERVVRKDLLLDTNVSGKIEVIDMEQVKIEDPVWIFIIEGDYKRLHFAAPKNAKCTFKCIDRDSGHVLNEETSCTNDGRHYANTIGGDCGGVLVQEGNIVGFHIATHRGPIQGLEAPLGESTINIYVGSNCKFLSDDTVDIDLSTACLKNLANFGPLFTSTICFWFAIIYLVNKRKFPVMGKTIVPRTYHPHCGNQDKSLADIKEEIISTCSLHGLSVTPTESQHIIDYAITALEEDFIRYITYSPHSLCSVALNSLDSYGYIYFNLDTALSTLIKDGTTKLESVLTLPSREYEDFNSVWFGNSAALTMGMRLYCLGYYAFMHAYGRDIFWTGIYTAMKNEFVLSFSHYFDALGYINLFISIFAQPADSMGIQLYLSFFDLSIRLFECLLIVFGNYFTSVTYYWYIGTTGIKSITLIGVIGISFGLLGLFVLFITAKGYYCSIDLHCYIIYLFMPFVIRSDRLREIVGVTFDILSLVNPGVVVCTISWLIYFFKSWRKQGQMVKLEGATDDTGVEPRVLYFNIGNQIAHALRRLPTIKAGRTFLCWFDQYGKTATLDELTTQLNGAYVELNNHFPNIFDEYIAHGYLSDMEIGSYLLNHYSVQVEGGDFLALVLDMLKFNTLRKFNFNGTEKLIGGLQRGFLHLLNAKRGLMNHLLTNFRTMQDRLSPEMIMVMKDATHSLQQSYSAYSKLYKDMARNDKKEYWTVAWIDLIEYLLKRNVNIDLYDDYKALVGINDLKQVNLLCEGLTEDMINIQEKIDMLRELTATSTAGKKEKAIINTQIGQLQKELKDKKVKFNAEKMEEQKRQADERRQDTLRNTLVSNAQRMQKKTQSLQSTYALAMARLANCLYYIGLLKKAGVNYDEVMEKLKRDYEQDYTSIWRHLNKQTAIRTEQNISNAIKVCDNDGNLTGFVTQNGQPVCVVLGANGEIRQDVNTVMERDTFLTTPGGFIPYGPVSIEAYFTSELQSTCPLPFVAPCGLELHCDRRGKHSKIICCSSFKRALEDHFESCDGCLSSFLNRKLSHGRCGEILRTSNLNSYIHSILLCNQCNNCSNCGGIARSVDNPVCSHTGWHGERCTQPNCVGCDLDHTPNINLENYDLNVIGMGALNKITSSKDGDSWSYFIQDDSTVRKVAHVGTGPPSGFIKVSKDQVKKITNKDVYIDPIILQQGQFYNFLQNLRTITIEGAHCNTCQKACSKECYRSKHALRVTKNEDLYDVLYFNDIIDSVEYLKMKSTQVVDHFAATTAHGTLYRAGSCTRVDAGHKQLCGLHGKRDILIPLSIPVPLHELYLHTYNFDRKCGKCGAGQWELDCFFCAMTNELAVKQAALLQPVSKSPPLSRSDSYDDAYSSGEELHQQQQPQLRQRRRKVKLEQSAIDELIADASPALKQRLGIVDTEDFVYTMDTPKKPVQAPRVKLEASPPPSPAELYTDILSGNEFTAAQKQKIKQLLESLN